MGIFRILSVCLAIATTPALAADDIGVIQQDLRSHSEAAKAAGRAGMQALAAGYKTAGCASLRTSQTEIATVRDLLARWRDALNLNGGSAAEIVMKQQKIDEMDGAWIVTASQVHDAIAKHCAA